MYNTEINMRDTVKGKIALIADVYKRGRYAEGILSPWELTYRCAIDYAGKCWSWRCENEEWVLYNKGEEMFVRVIEDMLGNAGPDRAKVEMRSYPA